MKNLVREDARKRINPKTEMELTALRITWRRTAKKGCHAIEKSLEELQHIARNRQVVAPKWG